MIRNRDSSLRKEKHSRWGVGEWARSSPKPMAPEGIYIAPGSSRCVYHRLVPQGDAQVGRGFRTPSTKGLLFR